MNVFITGGLTGMGFELSKLYLKNGHTVGICSFENYEDIKDKLLNNVQYFQADVTKKEDLAKAIEAFKNKNQTLDIVIANAGINMHKAKIPDFDRGRRVIETNVIGVINTFEPAIHIMKKQGHGHIAAIASISAFCGLPGMAIYGASKAAVKNMCESFAIDLKEYGITVTALAPGFVKTPLTSINQHKMPFVLEQNQAAAKMYKALNKRMKLYIFPIPMKFIAFFLEKVPRFFYRGVMGLDLIGLAKK